MKPIFFDTPVEFRKWLEKHHHTETEVWVGFWKKSSGKIGLTYPQALDEALCYGWIDGLVNKYDEKSYMQRFSPRKSKSLWSKINTQHVERLLREGKMTKAGLDAVAVAKSNGRWDQAYESPSNAKVSEDFIKELKKNKKAYAFFNTLNKANRYHMVFQLHHAKKIETRKSRIEKFIQKLEKGEKFY